MSQLGKGILLRGKTYWYRRMVQGKHLQISLHTEDPVEALRIASEIKNTGSVTFASAKQAVADGLDDQIKRYLDGKKATNGHSKATTRWAERALKQFSAHVKNKAVKLVTSADIQGFYESLRKRKYGTKGKKKQFSENAAHSYMRAIRGFMSWATDQRLCFINPAKKVKIGKASEPARLAFATKIERDAILAAATNDSIRYILFCTFYAGMRFNEVVESRPDWFNLKAGYVTIQKTDTFTVKNKKNRTVPLSTAFRAFLEDYGTPAPYMLEPTVTKGDSDYRYDFRKPWQKVLKDATAKMNEQLVKAGKKPTADLTWITPHLARHSFASILAQQGVSIFKISAWLGDTLEVATKHYAHLEPSDETIKALD